MYFQKTKIQLLSFNQRYQMETYTQWHDGTLNVAVREEIQGRVA